MANTPHISIDTATKQLQTAETIDKEKIGQKTPPLGISNEKNLGLGK